MLRKSDHRDIERAIRDFARAYEALETLQGSEAKKKPGEILLPHKGDQKTGLIGEYWAIRYARTIFKNVVFGGHSQKGWDLKIIRSRQPVRYVQVKTASDFGEGKVSPVWKPSKRIKAGDQREMPDYWDELWLLRLDNSLKPVALWTLQAKHVKFNGAKCLE
jgi:hypothetical protein